MTDRQAIIDQVAGGFFHRSTVGAILEAAGYFDLLAERNLLRETLQMIREDAVDCIKEAAAEAERVWKEKTETWNRGRDFENKRIAEIIKCEIEYMKGNPEGYEPAEIARYKRLLRIVERGRYNLVALDEGGGRE